MQENQLFTKGRGSNKNIGIWDMEWKFFFSANSHADVSISNTLALSQFLIITLNKGVSLNFRCPYQANVIKMFDAIKRITVIINLLQS